MTQSENLINTKPTYADCHATDEGWVDSKTNELLVAIKNLKTRLDIIEDTPTIKKRGRPRKIKDY